MNNSELDRIIEEKKQKYLPSRSTQLFHGGVIVLTSIVVGLIYFQFESMPAGVKPEDVGLLRQGLSILLGLFIAACSVVCYFVWTFWRGYKLQKETAAEFLVAVLKKFDKK